jgi:proteasome accessory factor B
VLRDEDAGVIRLHYTDAAVFADELAAYGPEVHVLNPASLREAVRQRLATVAAAHRDERHEGAT